jgi:hypothetical protein
VVFFRSSPGSPESQNFPRLDAGLIRGNLVAPANHYPALFSASYMELVDPRFRAGRRGSRHRRPSSV